MTLTLHQTRILELAEALETINPKKFNWAFFLSSDGPRPDSHIMDCGTYGCVAGHAWFLHGPGTLSPSALAQENFFKSHYGFSKGDAVLIIHPYAHTGRLAQLLDIDPGEEDPDGIGFAYEVQPLLAAKLLRILAGLPPAEDPPTPSNLRTAGDLPKIVRPLPKPGHVVSQNPAQPEGVLV